MGFMELALFWADEIRFYILCFYAGQDTGLQNTTWAAKPIIPFFSLP